MMIRFSLGAALLALAACATGYALPPQDRAAIATRIAGFEQAFLRGDTAQIVNVVPPRMIAAIAAQGGVSEPVLRQEMARLTREATADVRVVSFGLALDSATFLTTPSGRPYGLIPTQTVVQTAAGARLQSNTTTLTLEDGGLWHLIRIDDAPQIALMRKVYPDFEGVTFPTGSNRVVQ